MGRVRGAVAALLGVVLAVTPAQAAGAQDAPYVPPAPASWIVVDVDTGAVLEAQGDRLPHLPASTIKIFTALVAVQRLPADDGIPVSALAEGVPARKINVKAGQVWDLEDLLHSMLLASANDAAFAVAERIGGGSLVGWEQVAAETAARLGLADNPDLSDPAGLDDEFSHGAGSTISARDLAIVARAFLAEPALTAIAATPSYRFPGGDGVVHEVTNQNRFLGLYAGATGLKTGFTERAQRCFVGTATRDGRTLLVVMFDAPDIYVSAAQMLDRGFAVPVEAQAAFDHLPEVVPHAALDPPARVPGALDIAVAELDGGGGLDWNNPSVAFGVLVLGCAPLFAVRRRLLLTLGSRPGYTASQIIE